MEKRTRGLCGEMEMEIDGVEPHLLISRIPFFFGMCVRLLCVHLYIVTLKLVSSVHPPYLYIVTLPFFEESGLTN